MLLLPLGYMARKRIYDLFPMKKEWDHTEAALTIFTEGCETRNSIYLTTAECLGYLNLATPQITDTDTHTDRHLCTTVKALKGSEAKKMLILTYHHIYHCLPGHEEVNIGIAWTSLCLRR